MRHCGSVIFLVFFLAACGAEPPPLPSATAPASLTASPSQTDTPTLTASSTVTPEAPWYEPIDAAYAALEYRYGLVGNPQARVYASLQDAVDGTGNFGLLPDTPAYVSVVGEQTGGGKTYYTVYYGWMAAEEVQLVTPSPFRGILMTRPVDFRFGWVLRETQSVDGAGAPVRAFPRYEVVHEAPAEEPREGFIAIGPDEWLPEADLALTRASIPADAGEGTCRFLYVDLGEQTLRVYDGCRLVFATLVSTGKQAGWTFPGRFAILRKFPYIQLTPPEGSIAVYYLEGVPNFMTYYGDLGFHGAYWHDDFGTAVSHGCINLSPGDAKWLYEWAWEGERVVISAGE